MRLRVLPLLRVAVALGAIFLTINHVLKRLQGLQEALPLAGSVVFVLAGVVVATLNLWRVWQDSKLPH